MARPVPVIAAVADVTTLPTASVLLDGSGSLPSGGASAITAYQWTLVDKPVGSTASLSGATTATPSLDNVDLVGNYIVFLEVTDDAGRSSFGTPYAVQHLPPEDLVTFDVPLYAFESPVAGAFCVVKAPYASGAARLNQSLYKTGRGEYGWLDQMWETVDLLAEAREELLEVYDRPNKKLLADAVGPQTPAAGVTVDGLNVKDTGSITALDSNRATIRSLDDFSVAAGKTLRVEATGTARFDDIASTSGGDITSTSAVAAPEVKTPLVTSMTDIDVTAAGNITLTPTTFTQTSKPLVAPEVKTPLVTSTGTLSVSAGTNLALGANGTGAVDVGGTLALESNGADVAVIGETGVGVTATTGDATLTANAGDVVLTAGAEIELTPATFTTTAKPLFAPGHVYGVSKGFVAPATDESSPITLAAVTVTRAQAGGYIEVDASFRYLVGAGAQECDLAFGVTRDADPVTYFTLAEVGVGSKTAGRLMASLRLAFSAAPVNMSHPMVTIAEQVGAGSVTTTVDLPASLLGDSTGPWNIALSLAPRVGNQWLGGSSASAANGQLSVRLVNPTAEDVI